MLVSGLLISLALLFTVKKRDWKARPRWFFLIITIAAGVEWLEFLVVLMIDMLNFIQALTGFSDLFMGMTILGISNSFVDLFIDRAMAIQGYEILAVTGIFAGQMFNFLMGFGVSAVIKYIVNKGTLKFHLYDYATVFSNKTDLLVFAILIAQIICLVTLVVRLPILK